MTGVEEAALIAAVAPELLTATGGTLGMELAGLTAADAAAAGLGASAAGAGAAGAGAFGALAPELATAAGGSMGAEMGGSALLGGMPAASMTPSLLGGLYQTAPEMMTPGIGQYFPAPDLIGSDWATGVPGAAKSNTNPWLTGDKAMHLGRMAAGMGGEQPQQLGAPQGSNFDQPVMRPALKSQEEITKMWLLRNDPATYRRIYGAPQGVQ